MKEIFKKQTFMLIFSIVLGIFTMVLGVGYAIYVFDINVSDSNPITSVTSAKVDLKITPVSGKLGLCESYPIKTANALSSCTPYIFSVTNSNNVDVRTYLNLEMFNTSTLTATDIHIAFTECSDSTCQDTNYTDKLLSQFATNNDVANTGVNGYLIKSYINFAKNTTKYYKIVVWQDENSTLENSTFKGTIGAVSYNYTPPKPTTFAEDTWEIIAAVVKENPKAYAVGSTKTLKVYEKPNGETTNGTYKEYTVRVANNTTPAECNNEDFSQTACGFVVEFVDILELREMNNKSTNVGSWPASNLRTYANGDFFNKLPSDLQNIIVDTEVITGHGGTSGETNFTSTDKIYLLSGHEVYEAINGDVISTRDTAYNQTRQLDYYKEQGVTTSSYAAVIKKYLGSNSDWWLRSPVSIGNNYFLYILSDGVYDVNNIISITGFSPAFRIG